MAIRTLAWATSVLLAAWSCTVGAQGTAETQSDVKAIPLRTHSLASPYLDSDLSSRWWEFGGSTVVRTDKYIRLTGQQPSAAGWLFSRAPLTATNWEIEVEFKIHGTGNLFGDGMALWVTKERTEMGPVFGMKDRFEGLGIFFDTYKNNRPGVVFPYIMAMLGDGQTSYDQANDGKANELAGCSARGMRNTDFPTKAKLTYFQDKQLKLELMYKREDEYTKCFEIEGVKLPNIAYLGFSAETGELSDNHEIIRVDTKNLYSPSGATGSPAGSKEYSRNKAGNSKARQRLDKLNGGRNEGGSWLWFLVRAVLVLGFIAGAGYFGYTAYRARRRDRF